MLTVNLHLSFALCRGRTTDTIETTYLDQSRSRKSQPQSSISHRTANIVNEPFRVERSDTKMGSLPYNSEWVLMDGPSRKMFEEHHAVTEDSLDSNIVWEEAEGNGKQGKTAAKGKTRAAPFQEYAEDGNRRFTLDTVSDH